MTDPRRGLQHRSAVLQKATEYPAFGVKTLWEEMGRRPSHSLMFTACQEFAVAGYLERLPKVKGEGGRAGYRWTSTDIRDLCRQDPTGLAEQAQQTAREARQKASKPRLTPKQGYTTIRINPDLSARLSEAANERVIGTSLLAEWAIEAFLDRLVPVEDIKAHYRANAEAIRQARIEGETAPLASH